MTLEKLGNLLAEHSIVEQQTAYVESPFILDGEKAFAVGIEFGGRDLDEDAEFARRI